MNTVQQKGLAGLLIIIAMVVIVIVIGGSIWYLSTANNLQKQFNPQITLLTQSGVEKNVLRVGGTIDESGLAADTKEFQPFIDYLVHTLLTRGFPYTKGEFVGAHSVSEMAQLVREKKIDIIIDSAFPIYVVDTLAGAQVLVDRWKGGVEAYHSAIFVKENSPIHTLDDLKGKMLAFDSATATTGYFLPKAELIKQGYTLTQKTKSTDSCSPKEICYVFVHGNIYESVAKGIIPAGAESEIEIDAYFGETIHNYRIISRTPDILRFLVATRSTMDPNQRNAIKDILLTMHQTQQERIVLDSFAKTTKFTTVATTDTAYGVIKDLTSLVEDEIVQQ